MCGIAGVSGPNAAWRVMFITMTQLSRGTQGTGVAWIKDGVHVLKSPIHPVMFANTVLPSLEKLDATAAIGHNRQPSTGEVKMENTHPFVDCKERFCLVHNGIAVNGSVKTELIARGHAIKGETDSEIITHLLCEKMNEGMTMVEALQWLDESKEFSGSAILVLMANGTMYAMKDGWPPVVVARAKDGASIFVASTEEGIKTLGVPLSDAVFRPKTGQIVEIVGTTMNVIGKGRDEVTDFYVYEYRKDGLGGWIRKRLGREKPDPEWETYIADQRRTDGDLYYPVETYVPRAAQDYDDVIRGAKKLVRRWMG